MIKKVLFIISLLSCSLAYGAEQIAPYPLEHCAIQIPYGQPTVISGNALICRKAYILSFNKQNKTPDWVAWTLTPEHSIGCVARTNAFATDQSVLSTSPKPSDYVGSGYDKGHLANDADMSWDNQVEHESFLMTNMSPQLPSVNRGTWKNLESAARAWVYSSKQSHTIYAGNIGGIKTIGDGKVLVPDFLYKIVINNETNTSYAFLFPHTDGLTSDFSTYQTTVSEIEKASGFIFPIPDSKTVKNRIPVTDTKTIAADKKTKCSI